MANNKRVAWPCIKNANPAWIETTLTFDLDENGNLSFIHGNFDNKWKGAPSFEMTNDEWKHFMSSLKSYCETGKGQPW